MAALTDTRIRELFAEFQRPDLVEVYQSWAHSFEDTLKKVNALSDEELLKPAGQKALWKARGLGGIGPGESVNVVGAYSDPEIAAEMLKVRTADWGATVEERAKNIQAHSEYIIDLVNDRHSSRTPHAKLARAFTALRPLESTTCYSWNSAKVSARLFLGRRTKGRVGTAVLVSNRVQSVLVTPTTAAGFASRSIFIWWVVENEEDILAGSAISVPVEAVDADEAKKLTLWSSTKQIKGVPAVAGYHEAYRAVIRATLGGATSEDVVDTLEQDLESRSAKSRRSIFNRVRRLGFLQPINGLWHPSDSGEELLESDPPDVLVELVLIRFFGPAHLLRYLRQQPASSRKPICQHLRALYPNWTTNFAPGATLAWCRALGLAEQDDNDNWTLTPYGESWEKRLPDHLPVPPVAMTDLRTDTGQTSPSGTTQESLKAVSFDSIWERLSNAELTRQLVFSPEQVRALHTAWHFHPTKRFALLSGLSGTGKTRLLVEYARIYCALAKVPVSDNVRIVAVSPDWRDPTSLLGYFNALHEDPTFHPEPALQLLLRAADSPSEPFFLILDEMNLARVERYFAPFLSAMETGGALSLHAENEHVNGVPPTIAWPRNLFIGGTVNMDETTYAFSDKVLDRAFTLEFWEVDLPSLFRRRHDVGKRHEAGEALLLACAEALRPIRRHFGYRTASEFLDFLTTATEGSDDTALALAMFDQALLSKVLPRIRGEESERMTTALRRLITIVGEAQLPSCEAKLKQMLDRLHSSGVTRFWS